MSRRGPRGLTPEEKLLWKKVADRTSAMHPDRPKPLMRSPVNTDSSVHVPTARPVISAFRIGERRTETSIPHSIAPPVSERQAAQPVQMDRKSYDRLKRGKLTPEARIDLHGMTLEQAHGALNSFVLGAAAQGLRLLLVITGKGKATQDEGPIPRRGALKHQVPQWLHGPGLRPAVLQIAEAHLRHGGGGAYYVYLRRRK